MADEAQDKKLGGSGRGKPGPRPKSLIERMRVDVWYHAVKNRCGWTDSHLDVHFDLFSPDVLPHHKTGRKDYNARRRIFEGIRTYFRDPTKVRLGDKPIDLVALVDTDANFVETKLAYYAPIWNLMLAPPSFGETQLQLHGLMNELDLIIMPQQQLWELQHHAPDLELPRLYTKCLTYVAGHLPILIRLSLLGLLYRQTYLAGEFALTHELAIEFDNLCGRFYRELFVERGDDDERKERATKRDKYHYFTNNVLLGGARDAGNPAPGSRSFAHSPLVREEILVDPDRWQRMKDQIRSGFSLRPIP
ncbi:MAG: hypothetical protein HY273_07770 [Gammaproteobacteria bacterium]|nr:hypothetical protein [Gammaproteobacteria bacterium]